MGVRRKTTVAKTGYIMPTGVHFQSYVSTPMTPVSWRFFTLDQRMLRGKLKNKAKTLNAYGRLKGDKAISTLNKALNSQQGGEYC